MSYDFTGVTDYVDDVLAQHVNELQQALEAHEFLTLKAAAEISVSGGVLTVAQACHKVQPESGTADDIDTISGMSAGDVLVLYISDKGTDTLTFKHGTGNISCPGGADVSVSEGIVLAYSDGATVYISIGAGGGGGGETNTASNIGAAGVGVFDGKVGVDLQFKKLNAGSAKVTITDDAGNNEVDVDVDPTEIDHDDLQNGGSNTHSQIDTFIASKASASGLASLDGSSKVVQDPANATATPAADKIVKADGSGKADGWISDASDSVKGKVELATAGEVNGGSDSSRAITPDALAGANIGIRYLQLIVVEWETEITTGDGKFYIHIPPALNGMNLVYTHAEVITAGTAGTLDIQIHNATDAVDMLSTKLTVDSGETGSDTAAAPAVIDTAHDDVATNDVLRIDIDARPTTAPEGLVVTLGFQLP